MKFLLPYQRDDIAGKSHDYEANIKAFAAFLRARGFSEAELEQKNNEVNSINGWKGYLKIDTGNTLLSVRTTRNVRVLSYDNVPLVTVEINEDNQGRIVFHKDNYDLLPEKLIVDEEVAVVSEVLNQNRKRLLREQGANKQSLLDTAFRAAWGKKQYSGELLEEKVRRSLQSIENRLPKVQQGIQGSKYTYQQIKPEQIQEQLLILLKSILQLHEGKTGQKYQLLRRTRDLLSSTKTLPIEDLQILTARMFKHCLQPDNLDPRNATCSGAEMRKLFNQSEHALLRRFAFPHLKWDDEIEYSHFRRYATGVNDTTAFSFFNKRQAYQSYSGYLASLEGSVSPPLSPHEEGRDAGIKIPTSMKNG